MLLRKIREKERRVCVRKSLSLRLVIWYLWVAIWNSERGLCRLVLVLWFGDLFSLGALKLLDLICGSLFGLCAIRIWYSYLVFVNLWFFGSYLNFWFCICKRELFGCIWDLGLWECLYTNLYYPKFVIMKFFYRRLWM